MLLAKMSRYSLNSQELEEVEEAAKFLDVNSSQSVSTICTSYDEFPFFSCFISPSLQATPISRQDSG